MQAIVEIQGKQYKVAEGLKIHVDRLPQAVGEVVSFPSVLCVMNEGSVTVGHPHVEKAKIEARVSSHGKAPKVLIFKKRRRKNSRRKRGFRHQFTELVIEKIANEG